jgi:hypothetical protein
MKCKKMQAADFADGADEMQNAGFDLCQINLHQQGSHAPSER